jgi:predicted GH43/DUF377 family glycosyl hydrolase
MLRFIDRNMAELQILDTRKLLPDELKHSAAAGSVYAFNPSLLRLSETWLLAYRLVLPDGLRRIALCQLNDQLEVIPGSVVPFSDKIRFPVNSKLPPQALGWFADPRLYRLGSRYFLHWNSGWHEPQNYQFLQEFDPKTLQTFGPPREMRLDGSRQAIEKNWTLWGENSYYACYSPNPHKVLGFDLAGEGPLHFCPAYEHAWSNRIYERRYGKLRGGAAPIRVGESYLALCHSMHGQTGSAYDYEAAAYTFSASPPFAPILAPHRPIQVNPPTTRQLPPLNQAVGRVIYPCGLSQVGQDLLVSLGLNDEHCALLQLKIDELRGSLIAIA